MNWNFLLKSKVNPEHSKSLDQFYTNPDYANYFYNKINETVNFDNATILLEPSAGTGNFYCLMDQEKRIGIDLDPKVEGIIQQDFLTWTPNSNEIIYTIGNPPFGKNSSLAIKFFNHAATFSEVIAFVLPKTFRKESLIKRLNDKFHCIFDEDVNPNCFIFNGLPYDVWCCSQIWIKKTVKRIDNIILNKNDFTQWFDFVDVDQADFSIQRVGSGAGIIRTSDFLNRSPSSHYFIKQKEEWVLTVFEQLDFTDVKTNTAGNPSVSLGELLTLWNKKAIELNLLKKHNVLDFF
jgi:predicted RNA methylase